MTGEAGAVDELAERLDEARSSDRRLGERIAADADIAFTRDDDTLVVTVGATPDSGGRTVRFDLHGDLPAWSCTCRSDASPWCKHVVAAVIGAGGRT